MLSYPRTDCTYSTDEEFDYLVDNRTKYLDLVSNPVLLQSLKYKTKNQLTIS
ncbi:DNA topoisomerase III [Lactococcus cremoris]|nr:DNA topoisomerase III [Lactococcus cremoris]